MSGWSRPGDRGADGEVAAAGVAGQEDAVQGEQDHEVGGRGGGRVASSQATASGPAVATGVVAGEVGAVRRRVVGDRAGRLGAVEGLGPPGQVVAGPGGDQLAVPGGVVGILDGRAQAGRRLRRRRAASYSAHSSRSKISSDHSSMTTWWAVNSSRWVPGPVAQARTRSSGPADRSNSSLGGCRSAAAGLRRGGGDGGEAAVPGRADALDDLAVVVVQGGAEDLVPFDHRVDGGGQPAPTSRPVVS